jgi:hypothetical protein
MTLMLEGREFKNVKPFPPFRGEMSLASPVIAKGLSADQRDIAIQGIKIRRRYAIHTDRI